MKKSREVQNETSKLFESTVDEWANSARKRMTVEGLREASERLRLGQKAINEADWRGPQNR